MKLVQIASGVHGLRQLAAARAEIELRKRGYLPAITYRSNGRDRAWTDEQYDEACIMRLTMNNREIAKATGRTKLAVSRQFGPG